MALLATVYCTIPEVERFLSPQAVTDFGDHDSDGLVDDDVVEDCINQATQLVDFYLHHAHTSAQLAGSTLVNRWCVVMSSRYLCQRRGNPVPDSIELEWQEEIKPLLEEVRRRREALPGIALRAELVPTVSNLKVDRRFRNSKIRVVPTTSSKAPTTRTQDRVVEGPAFWD